jgi:ClpX C4-type zinc finger/Sigma-70, region 4
MIEEQHAACDPSSRKCSFCNESEAEVGSLIDGPWIEGTSPVFICASCVDLCSTMFQHWKKYPAARAGLPPEAAEAFNRQFDETLNNLNLDDLESRVIKLRYGLADGTYHTHKEVAEALEITPERVREIEFAVIKKAQSRRDSSQ